MNWLARLLRRAPPLDAGQIAALEAYRSRGKPDLRLPLSGQRLVVVDVETSGLDPYRDRLISIGAVTVSGELVRFDETFEVVLQQERPSDHHNILVHGIGGSAQLLGRDPAAGLLDFLAFSGNAPLVAFNSDFDRILIERAAAATLGVKPDNAWLDLARLAPALFSDHERTARTLDDWMAVFGIENHARHDALVDAFATAQLLLTVLAAAKVQGIGSCAELIRLERGWRWLGRRPR